MSYANTVRPIWMRMEPPFLDGTNVSSETWSRVVPPNSGVTYTNVTAAGIGSTPITHAAIATVPNVTARTWKRG